MQKPLAVILRPQSIDDVVGQDHLLGDGRIIRKMIKAKRLSSFILYGQPGIGKSTIAYAIANTLDYPFFAFNASTDTKKDLQAAIKQSTDNPIVLLVDEIHRLTKPLQDYLLPFTENGQIIMIGATTQNPYIEIAPAIRSRAQIFELHALSQADMATVLDRALAYLAKDQKISVHLSDDARQLLTSATNGDVRSMLTALEIMTFSADSLPVELTVQDVEAVVQRKQLSADKSGDSHYDVLSALQKSIRGSDTDAALHYAARLVVAGDLQSLIRRLTVIAYEDIGLSDPVTASQAVTAINMANSLGLPEARIPLSNAVILLATATKSNSAYKALDAAIADVDNGYIGQIPDDIKDGHYAGAKKLGHAVGYKYPFDYPLNWVAQQQYLPDQLIDKGTHYFQPNPISSTEKALYQRYTRLKQAQTEALESR